MPMPRFYGRSEWLLLAALLGLIAILAVGSLLVGSRTVGVWESWHYLLDASLWQGDSQAAVVVRTLRLPRTLAGVLLGLALGLSGSVLQVATRNPLAETGLLGVNAGAALAVVVGITTFGAQSAPAYMMWAGLGAIFGCWIVIAIAGSSAGGTSPLRLVLAGVAVSSTCAGLTAFLVLRSGAGLEQYRHWVLGSLAGTEMAMVKVAAPTICLAVVLTVCLIRPLAALELGDDTARALGHRPSLIRVGVMLVVTLMAGTAVAMAGPIAFLGLVAPHAARPIAGARVGALCLFASVIGAAILLSADIASRLVVRPYETPVSVLLAFIGAPLLIWLARQDRIVSGGTP